jgi:hypothetical protein
MPIRTPFALLAAQTALAMGQHLTLLIRLDAAQKTVQSALFADPH